MNKVIIKGNICKDLELRYSSSNIAVVKFTIAVKRNYKNKDGEYESDFINCIAYKTVAEVITKYFSKGSGILAYGRIQTGSYDNKDGNKVFTTDIVVEEIDFIDKKNIENNRNQEVKKEEVSDPFADFGKEHQEELTDDNLPF